MSEPDLVSLLDLGKEPWVVKGELARGPSPGERGRPGVEMPLQARV